MVEWFLCQTPSEVHVKQDKHNTKKYKKTFFKDTLFFPFETIDMTLCNTGLSVVFSLSFFLWQFSSSKFYL